jgi:LysW-gamma-L-lysine carboxypeptidase
VLLGHIDTVPGEIPVRVEGGVLFGRGSVDAKGPLAAMLAAASRAELADGVALHVIAAVGEESAESPGAKWARDRMSPDACIIGEPSGWDGVTLGYKGRLIVRARCERDSAHSAGPGETPADSLFTWWTRITNRLESLNNNRAGVFDRVQYSIASTRSNTDGLTARGELDCGFRLPMWLGPDELFIEIQRLTGEEIVISHRGGEQTCRSDRNDPVVRALVRSVREVGGMRAREKVKTGTADFNVVAPQWGCPIAAYGPGDSSLDHTPNERLCLNEYLASVRVMTNAIEMIAFELAGDIR